MRMPGQRLSGDRDRIIPNIAATKRIPPLIIADDLTAKLAGPAAPRHLKEAVFVAHGIFYKDLDIILFPGLSCLT